MSLMSFTFIVFLAVVFLAYFLTPPKYQWIVLLIFSYLFYMYAGVKLIVFLLFTTATTFYAGKKIGKVNEEYAEKIKNEPKEQLTRARKKELKEEGNKKKRVVMVITLLLNFGVLFVLKYFPFLSIPTNWVLGVFNVDYRLPDTSLLLPLGISFYTFQSMGYIIDLYRNKYDAETSLPRFALFVSFFPQLIQGPISRFDELALQLYEPHKFEYKRFKFGLELMLWGYFKKMIISDRIAVITSTVFGNPDKYQGFYLIFAAVLSWIELYVDFSGGIDIARGVAESLGIIMPENFKRPFFADSLAEFWRRWHITLNNWWRDYIFYPITLSKTFSNLGHRCRKIFGNEVGKKMPMMVALLIIRIINGVWHGAYCIYFIGGIYHGVIIALAFFLEPQFKKWAQWFHVNTECLSWKIFRIVRTFILICVPRIFYTAKTLDEVVMYIKYTFAKFNPWIFFDDSLFALGVERKQFHVVVIALCVLFVVSLLQEKGYCIREKLEEQNVIFRWSVYFAGLISIILFGVYGLGYDAAGFQYMNF